MINCNTYFRMMPFFCFHISQGSVATRLKRGEIFKSEFVANLPSSRLLKKIWKSVNIWWSYGQEFGVLFFFDSQCRKPTLNVAPITLAQRTQLHHIINCIHSKNGNTLYFLWPRTLTCDSNLLTWPIKGQGNPACQVSRSKITYFKSYCQDSQICTH